jgi:four helix bundle protein
MFASLPNTAVAQVLGKQVLRSGTSVGANYREVSPARSKAEFISKCGDALRELEESAYWMELLVNAGVASSDQLSSLFKECDFCLLPSDFPLRPGPSALFSSFSAPLAQLAEQVTLNHWVIGSIPMRCTLKINDLRRSL